NLIQEMAPLNNAFRTALIKSLNKWKRAIEAEIIRGQQTGQLDTTHDAKQIALNVITLYHGVRNMGKLLGKPYYISFLKEFRRYLDILN
ncbi:TetR family transcriptional regulator C-terminal domain-containing protein, partial [Pedobacter sp.]|uniref:TetR family transcriptional regulator C-terminal domain-containing protein n=1 Tax=Pedobacter sp. TaxID=1411316 RepID=UPI002C20C88B